MECCYCKNITTINKKLNSNYNQSQWKVVECVILSTCHIALVNSINCPSPLIQLLTVIHKSCINDMWFHWCYVGSGLWACKEFSNTSCRMVQFVTIKKTITVIPEFWFIHNLRHKNNTTILRQKNRTEITALQVLD